MSHVEPEHNRPQEGEEPDEPFPPITKEWLMERAHLEEGQEIGAGQPTTGGDSGCTTASAALENATTLIKAHNPTTGEHKPWCQAITSERGVGPFPCDCNPTTGDMPSEEVQAMRERLKGIDEVDNPTTGEVCGFTGNTIPATGEWTVIKLGGDLCYIQFSDGSTSVQMSIGVGLSLVDKHNAALAAEEQKRADWNVVIEDLERALAAEREGYAMALQMVHIEGKRANEAEKQLAVEREFMEQLARHYGRANRQMLHEIETHLGKKLPKPHQ